MMGKGRVYEPQTRCDLKQWKTMFFQKIKNLPWTACSFQQTPLIVKIFKNPEATVISFWNFMKPGTRTSFILNLKKN